MSSASSSDAQHELPGDALSPAPVVGAAAPHSAAEKSLRSHIDAMIAPEILEAKEAFERDLPELVREHEGQWVAYYRRQRIAFGSSMPGLYQQCFQQGYHDKKILVRFVEEPFDGPCEVLFDV
ncbi:MAG: hypothetical protein HYS13_05575 [Planctomycetia bacterium]|nr:hypothetical protein [Planctomycetia bacterium]